MFNDKKSNFLNDFFFISILFEKDFILFYSKTFFLKNQINLFSRNINILKCLKFNIDIKPITLIDITTIDNSEFHITNLIKSNMFKLTVIYNLLSYKLNSYVNIYFLTHGVINSLNNYFHNTSWLEREQYEFFGVFFLNSLDLRNLLLEYNTTNNILLKEFDVVDNTNYRVKYYELFEKTNLTYSKI